jgi:hypothetical protein
MGTKWIVRVDDNFHYGDEDERYRYGAYGNYDEAVSACRKIVDEYLESASAETAEELWDSYTSFGEDPWIDAPPPTGSERFSAWTYAKQRCLRASAIGRSLTPRTTGPSRRMQPASLVNHRTSGTPSWTGRRRAVRSHVRNWHMIRT